MFEKPLSALIASHLKKFLQDISEEQLRLSVWKGEVCLENLQLREDIFDQISLLVWQQSSANNLGVAASPALASLLMPFTVVRGTVRKLRIGIPWSSLDSEPVTVELDGVDLIVGPLRHRPYNKEEERVRKEAVKATQMAAFEACVADQEAKAKAKAPPPDRNRDEVAILASALASTDYIGGDLADEQILAKSAGLGISAFFERIVASVSRNIQFEISNVTVGFSFDYAGLSPRNVFALECAIDKIKVVPVGKDLQPARVAVDDRLRRAVTVEGLHIRCKMGKVIKENATPNPFATSTNKSNSPSRNEVDEGNDSDTQQPVEEQWSTTHTIVEKLNVKAYIQDPHVDGTTLTTAKRDISIEIDPVRVNAVREVVTCVQNAITSITKALDYAPHRPFLDHLSTPCAYNHSHVAAQRWRFALAAVVESLRLQRRNSHVLSTFLKAKTRYVSLFKRSKGLEWYPPLEPEDSQRMLDIEEVMLFDQIAVLRSIAYAEIDVERAQYLKHKEVIKKAKGAYQSKHEGGGGWGSWMGWGNGSGGGGSAPQTPVSTTSSNVSLKPPPPMTIECPTEGWTQLDLAQGIAARLRQYDEFKQGHSILLKSPVVGTSSQEFPAQVSKPVVQHTVIVCTVKAITLVAGHPTISQRLRTVVSDISFTMNKIEGQKAETMLNCQAINAHLVDESDEICLLTSSSSGTSTSTNSMITFETNATRQSTLSIQGPHVTIPGRTHLHILNDLVKSFSAEVSASAAAAPPRAAFLEAGNLSPPKSPVLPVASFESLLTVTVTSTLVSIHPRDGTQLAELVVPHISVKMTKSGFESRTSLEVRETKLIICSSTQTAPSVLPLTCLHGLSIDMDGSVTSVRLAGVEMVVSPTTGPSLASIIEEYSPSPHSLDSNTSQLQIEAVTPQSRTPASGPTPPLLSPTTIIDTMPVPTPKLLVAVSHITLTILPITTNPASSSSSPALLHIGGDMNEEALKLSYTSPTSQSVVVGPIQWRGEEASPCQYVSCRGISVGVSLDGTSVQVDTPRIVMTAGLESPIAVLAGTVGSVMTALPQRLSSPTPSAPLTSTSATTAPQKQALVVYVKDGLEVVLTSSLDASITVLLDGITLESKPLLPTSVDATTNSGTDELRVAVVLRAITLSSSVGSSASSVEAILPVAIPITFTAATTAGVDKRIAFAVGGVDKVSMEITPVGLATIRRCLVASPIPGIVSAASVNRFVDGVPHRVYPSPSVEVEVAVDATMTTQQWIEGRCAPLEITVAASPHLAPLLSTSEVLVTSVGRHLPLGHEPHSHHHTILSPTAATGNDDVETIVLDISMKSLDVAGMIHVGDVLVHIAPKASISGIPSSMSIERSSVCSSATYIVVRAPILLSLSPDTMTKWILLSRLINDAATTSTDDVSSPAVVSALPLQVCTVGSPKVVPTDLGITIKGVRGVVHTTSQAGGHFTISSEGLGFRQIVNVVGGKRMEFSTKCCMIEDSSLRTLPDANLSAASQPSSPTTPSSSKLMPEAFKLLYIELIAFSSTSLEAGAATRTAVQVSGAIVCPIERSLTFLRDSILPDVPYPSEADRPPIPRTPIPSAPSSPTSPQHASGGTTTKNQQSSSSISVSIASLEVRLCEPWLEPVAAITMDNTEIAIVSGPNTLMPECAADKSTVLSVTFLEGISIRSLEKAHIGTPLEHILTPMPDTAITLSLELATTAPAWHNNATAGLSVEEYRRVAVALYTGRGIDLRASGLSVTVNVRTLSRIVDNIFSQLLPLAFIGEPPYNRLPTYYSAVRMSNRLRVSISDLTINPPSSAPSITTRVKHIDVTNTITMSDVLKWKQCGDEGAPQRSWQHSFENITIGMKGVVFTPHLTTSPVDVSMQFSRPMTFTSHVLNDGPTTTTTNDAILGTLVDMQADLSSKSPFPLQFAPKFTVTTTTPTELIVSTDKVERLLAASKWGNDVVTHAYHAQDSAVQHLVLDAQVALLSAHLMSTTETCPRLKICLGNKVRINTKGTSLAVSCLGNIRVVDHSGGVVLCGHQDTGLVDIVKQGGDTVVQVKDISVDVNGHRILSLLKAYDVVESIVAVVIPMEAASTTIPAAAAAAVGDTTALTTTSKPPTLKVTVLNTRVSIPNYADLMIRTLDATHCISVLPTSPTATTTTPATPEPEINVSCSDVTLIDRRPTQHHDKLPIVVVSGTTAAMARGVLALTINSILVNNDSTFFGDLFMAAIDVQAHVHRRWKRVFKSTASPSSPRGGSDATAETATSDVSSPTEQPHSKTDINIKKFTLKMRATAITQTTNQCPTLTLVYPGISVHSTTTSSSSSLVVDAHGGSLQYHDGTRALRPLCSGMDLRLVQTSSMTESSTRVSLPEAFVSVPGGAPLHGCTSVVAETLAPLLSLVKVLPGLAPAAPVDSSAAFKPTSIVIEAGKLGFEVFEFDTATDDDVIVVSATVIQPTCTLSTTATSEQVQLSIGAITSTAEEGVQRSPITCTPRAPTREGRDSASVYALYMMTTTLTTLEGAKEHNVLRCGDLLVALSPQLIHIIHRDIVEPAAAGVRAASLWTSSTRRRGSLDESTASNVSDYFGTATSLSDDFTFSEGVSIGGQSSSTLHIRKLRSSPNVIRLKGQHGASLHLHRGPEAAIVVDDGVSVYCDDGLSIVLEKPGDVLADYVSLGCRSFIKINPARIQFRQSASNTQRSHHHIVPASIRKFERVWDVDGFVGVELGNRSQRCAIGSCIHVDYKIVVDAESKKTLSEEGNIGFPRFAIETGCGTVPVYLTTQVAYRTPQEGGTEEGRTTVNVILDGLSVRASQQDVGLVRDGLSVVGSMFETINTLTSELQEMTLRHDAAFDPALDQSNSGGASRRSLLQKPGPDGAVSSSSLDAARSVTDIPNQSQVYFVFNGPSVELLLQDDRNQMMASFAMQNTIIQVTGTRDLSSLSIVANTWITAEDKPFGWGVPRALLDAQPEVVVTIDRMQGGGISCEAAAAFPRTVVTIPVPSLLSLLNHTFHEPPRGSLQVVNSTGVPLILYPLKAVEKRHSRMDSILGELLAHGASRQFGSEYHLGTCFYVTTAASQQNAEPTPPVRVPFGLQVDEPALLPELNTTANMVFGQYIEKDKTVVLSTGAFLHSSLNDVVDPTLTMLAVDMASSGPTQEFMRIPSRDQPPTALPFSLLPHRIAITSSVAAGRPAYDPLPPLEVLLGMARSEAAPAEGIQITVPINDRDCVVVTVKRRPCTIAAHAKVDVVITPHTSLSVELTALISITPSIAGVCRASGGRSIINFFAPTHKVSLSIDSLGVPCVCTPVDLRAHTEHDTTAQLHFKDKSGRTLTLNLTRLSSKSSPIRQFKITAKNVIRNLLPVAFHLVGAKGAVLAGTVDSDGPTPLGIQPGKDLAMCSDVSTVRLQLLEPHFATSQEFTMQASLTTSVAAVKAPLVHIASIYSQGGITHVAPLWTITNGSSLPISITSHTTVPAIHIAPNGGTAQLMTFDASTAVDPIVTLHVEGYEGFKVPLTTISLKSARGAFHGLLRSKVAIRHDDGGDSGTASILRDTTGNICGVGCLSLEITRIGEHQVGIKVGVVAEDSKFPISIENRLPTPALVEQPSSDTIYNIGPYHTAPMAWDTLHGNTQILHLHITHPTTKRLITTVVDLQKLPHSIEGIVVGNGDIIINPTVTGGRVVLSISADRMLSSLLVSSPRSCFNASLFVRSLEVHITSLVSTKPGSFFYDRAMEGDFGAHAADGPSAFLNRREMDLLRIFSENIAVGLTENGKHQLVKVGVRSLRIEDIMKTSPRLATILAILPTGNEEHKPSLSLMLHQVRNEGISSKDIKVLRVETNTVCLAVGDRLLHTLRGAAERLMEKDESDTSSYTSPSEGGGGAVNITAAPTTRLLEQAICIEKLYISSIPLRLTISRRSDLRYNPFTGIPLNNILLQSIDSAPITLREITAANVVVPEGQPVLGHVASQLLAPAYRTDVILQVYKVLGSMEVLGNPVMFTSQISSGLRDFVVSTATLHPIEGMSSLLRATSSSALHTYSLFSKASGRLVGSLSFDRKWLEQCEDPTQNALISGLEQGASGLLSAPMRGARERGFAGFMTGMASGATGVLTKPLSGALVQMSRFAENSSSALRREVDKPIEITDRVFAATRNYLDDDDAIISHPSYAPTPRSIGDVLDEYEHLLPANPLAVPAASHALFITRRQYLQEAVRLGKGPKSPKATSKSGSDSVHTRALCDAVGAHNFAQYAPLVRFNEVATPDEYLLWAHLALHREVMEKLVASMSPQQSSSSSQHHPSQKGGVEGGIDAAALERTLHLKATLGAGQMLKYVTLPQYAAVVSWGEARTASNPRTFKDKVGPALWAEVQRMVASTGATSTKIQHTRDHTDNST